MKKRASLIIVLLGLLVTAGCEISQETIDETLNEAEVLAQETYADTKDDIAEYLDTNTYAITLKDGKYDPSEITVQKGVSIKLNIEPVDGDSHFCISDFNVSSTLPEDKTTTIEFFPDAKGTFSFSNAYPCQKNSGTVEGTLIVE